MIKVEALSSIDNLSDTFVGRSDPVRRIQDVVSDTTNQAKVRIISISGPGGVGKSWLFEKALSGLELSTLEYLKLGLNGKSNALTLCDMVTLALTNDAPVGLRGNSEFFRMLRQAREHLRIIDKQARKKLEKAKKGDENAAKAIAAVFNVAVGVLELKSRKLAHAVGRLSNDHVESVVKYIQDTDAFADEYGVAGFQTSGARKRNLFRKDLEGQLAEHLLGDLKAILSSFLPKPITGFNRLMMVLDDYEVLSPSFDSFLRRSLLPVLKTADFSSIIVILGRDSFRDVSNDGDMTHDREIVIDERLSTLPEIDADAYLHRVGITATEVRARIIEASMGFPFLLAAEADSELHGQGRALTLQKFVDRTTRWMTSEQKQWALALAFLDEINEDTVQLMLPKEEPTMVVDWFKREASLRSPQATNWAMLPLIRYRFQNSVRIDSPTKYRAFKELATQASKISHED